LWQLFWLDRPLMAFEKANGYYGPGAYFTSKVRFHMYIYMYIFTICIMCIYVYLSIYRLCSRLLETAAPRPSEPLTQTFQTFECLNQLLSDLIPLRIVPPVLLASITTAMIGFRGGSTFMHYCFVLVSPPLLFVIIALYRIFRGG
jgi:hypothetical protein